MFEPPCYGEVELIQPLMDGDRELVASGTSGIVTAFLPDEGIFAVFFGDGKWFSFENETEADFNKRFSWIKKPN